MSQVRPGVLISALTLIAFAVYAFFAPATYRSSALIAVEPVASGAPVVLPEPLEAARRLREAILDRTMLERLARERASSQSPEARAKAASLVRDALAIDTSDAHSFSVSYSDSDATRAQRVCDQLALHGVEQAPRVLGTADQERAAQLRRQRQTQELAAFLTLHPEVASTPAPANDGHPDRIDPAMSALRAEKALVERRLTEGPDDNPYAEPADNNPEILKRRLAELDAAIAVRKKSLESQAGGQKLSPELAEEWRRLVSAVANVDDDVAPAPRLSARLLTPASSSIWPVEPNRPLFLFFGVVFGVGFGSAYALVARAAQRRRSSSRPPPGVKETQLLVLPKAPGLPKGFETAPTVQAPGLGATLPIARPVNLPHAASPAGSSRPPGPSEPPPQAPNEPPRPSSSAPPPALFSAPEPPLAGGFVAPQTNADPVLVAAAQAWDQAVRTNNVPGFAVVGSPPARALESARPPPASAGADVAAAKPSSPPRSAHKVTQPLGSFMPDALAESMGLVTHPSPPPVARREYPPRSPLPAKGPPSGATRYSYVSSAPPPVAVAGGEPLNVLASAGWSPDPSLLPKSQRSLCERFYPLAVERCVTITVVSVPECHEQKSRVAAEIALALAESGHPRVLLVEGDFYRPQVHRLLRASMPMGAGFSQQIHTRIQGNNPERWTVLSCTSSLHVIAEGMMRTPGLLLSHQFGDAMSNLRSYYDFIIIDGPTTSLDVDSHAALAVSDEIVIVRPLAESAALARVEALFPGKQLNYVTV